MTNPGTAVWRTMTVRNMGPGLVQSLEFLKKSSNLPSNFPDMEINRDKVWSFLCFPRSLLITYLLTMSLEKYSDVLEKVLNFGSKSLCQPCVGSVRLRLESHYLLDSNVV